MQFSQIRSRITSPGAASRFTAPSTLARPTRRTAYRWAGPSILASNIPSTAPKTPTSRFPQLPRARWSNRRPASRSRRKSRRGGSSPARPRPQAAYLTAAASGHDTCAKQGQSIVRGLSNRQQAGEVNEGAFLIYYPLNKHFDVYSGVNYSVNAGGLSSGCLNNNMTTFASGFRLKF
jgi:hypothetical protein